jgi:Protein of unknown function (DUF664)
MSVPRGRLRVVDDPGSDLHRYLRAAREALVWELDGLGEHDARRPLTATGTDPLGLVEHAAGVEPDADLRPGNGTTAPGDAARWEDHRRRVADAASAAARGKGTA